MIVSCLCAGVMTSSVPLSLFPYAVAEVFSPYFDGISPPPLMMAVGVCAYSKKKAKFRLPSLKISNEWYPLC